MAEKVGQRRAPSEKLMEAALRTLASTASAIAKRCGVDPSLLRAEVKGREGGRTPALRKVWSARSRDTGLSSLQQAANRPRPVQVLGTAEEVKDALGLGSGLCADPLTPASRLERDRRRGRDWRPMSPPRRTLPPPATQRGATFLREAVKAKHRNFARLCPALQCVFDAETLWPGALAVMAEECSRLPGQDGRALRLAARVAPPATVPSEASCSRAPALNILVAAAAGRAMRCPELMTVTEVAAELLEPNSSPLFAMCSDGLVSPVLSAAAVGGTAEEEATDEAVAAAAAAVSAVTATLCAVREASAKAAVCSAVAVCSLSAAAAPARYAARTAVLGAAAATAAAWWDAECGAAAGRAACTGCVATAMAAAQLAADERERAEAAAAAAAAAVALALAEAAAGSSGDAAAAALCLAAATGARAAVDAAGADDLFPALVAVAAAAAAEAAQASADAAAGSADAAAASSCAAAAVAAAVAAEAAQVGADAAVTSSFAATSVIAAAAAAETGQPTADSADAAACAAAGGCAAAVAAAAVAGAAAADMDAAASSSCVAASVTAADQSVFSSRTGTVAVAERSLLAESGSASLVELWDAAQVTAAAAAVTAALLSPLPAQQQRWAIESPTMTVERAETDPVLDETPLPASVTCQALNSTATAPLCAMQRPDLGSLDDPVSPQAGDFLVQILLDASPVAAELVTSVAKLGGADEAEIWITYARHMQYTVRVPSAEVQSNVLCALVPGHSVAGALVMSAGRPEPLTGPGGPVRRQHASSLIPGTMGHRGSSRSTAGSEEGPARRSPLSKTPSSMSLGTPSQSASPFHVRPSLAGALPPPNLQRQPSFTPTLASIAESILAPSNCSAGSVSVSCTSSAQGHRSLVRNAVQMWENQQTRLVQVSQEHSTSGSDPRVSVCKALRIQVYLPEVESSLSEICVKFEENVVTLKPKCKSKLAQLGADCWATVPLPKPVDTTTFKAKYSSRSRFLTLLVRVKPGHEETEMERRLSELPGRDDGMTPARIKSMWEQQGKRYTAVQGDGLFSWESLTEEDLLRCDFNAPGVRETVPERLIIQMYVPEVKESIRECAVDLVREALRVHSAETRKLIHDLVLPFPVDPFSVKAKFGKQSQLLTVTARVQLVRARDENESMATGVTPRSELGASLVGDDDCRRDYVVAAMPPDADDCRCDYLVSAMPRPEDDDERMRQFDALTDLAVAVGLPQTTPRDEEPAAAVAARTVQRVGRGCILRRRIASRLANTDTHEAALGAALTAVALCTYELRPPPLVSLLGRCIKPRHKALKSLCRRQPLLRLLSESGGTYGYGIARCPATRLLTYGDPPVVRPTLRFVVVAASLAAAAVSLRQEQDDLRSFVLIQCAYRMRVARRTRRVAAAVRAAAAAGPAVYATCLWLCPGERVHVRDVPSDPWKPGLVVRAGAANPVLEPKALIRADGWTSAHPWCHIRRVPGRRFERATVAPSRIISDLVQEEGRDRRGSEMLAAESALRVIAHAATLSCGVFTDPSEGWFGPVKKRVVIDPAAVWRLLQPLSLIASLPPCPALDAFGLPLSAVRVVGCEGPLRAAVLAGTAKWASADSATHDAVVARLVAAAARLLDPDAAAGRCPPRPQFYSHHYTGWWFGGRRAVRRIQRNTSMYAAQPDLERPELVARLLQLIADVIAARPDSLLRCPQVHVQTLLGAAARVAAQRPPKPGCAASARNMFASAAASPQVRSVLCDEYGAYWESARQLRERGVVCEHQAGAAARRVQAAWRGGVGRAHVVRRVKFLYRARAAMWRREEAAWEASEVAATNIQRVVRGWLAQLGDADVPCRLRVMVRHAVKAHTEASEARVRQLGVLHLQRRALAAVVADEHVSRQAVARQEVERVSGGLVLLAWLWNAEVDELHTQSEDRMRVLRARDLPYMRVWAEQQEGREQLMGGQATVWYFFDSEGRRLLARARQAAQARIPSKRRSTHQSGCGAALKEVSQEEKAGRRAVCAEHDCSFPMILRHAAASFEAHMVRLRLPVPLRAGDPDSPRGRHQHRATTALELRRPALLRAARSGVARRHLTARREARELTAAADRGAAHNFAAPQSAAAGRPPATFLGQPLRKVDAALVFAAVAGMKFGCSTGGRTLDPRQSASA